MIKIHMFTNFQMIMQLPIGSGQDHTFGFEWINGTYAINFTSTGP